MFISRETPFPFSLTITKRQIQAPCIDVETKAQRGSTSRLGIQAQGAGQPYRTQPRLQSPHVTTPNLLLSQQPRTGPWLRRHLLALCSVGSAQSPTTQTNSSVNSGRRAKQET